MFEFVRPNSDAQKDRLPTPLHPGNGKAFMETSIEKEILKKDLTLT